MKILSIFKRIKDAFSKKQKPVVIDGKISSAAPSIKRKGRGAYFNNNRKRTKGRTLQCIIMGDRTKFIRHETI